MLAIGLIASSLALLTGIALAITGAVGIVKAQLAADLSALVAADSLVGAVAGYPCENAESVAIRNGASLTTCRIVGLVAEVSTTTSLGPFQVSRWAEAG